MPVDTKTLLIIGGFSIIAIVGGVYVYKTIRTQKIIAGVGSVIGEAAKRFLGNDQGAVGTIPLSYANAPMAAYNINPALR